MSDDYISKTFGPDGTFSKHFEAYELREGQISLAYSVADAMEGEHRLMVEGPTGTGKSVAYGVPAVYHAAQGNKVVIVTANIALQEQLVSKDLPMLREVLPWDFEFALAKGLSNYLCKDELEDNESELLLVDDMNDDDRGMWNDIVAWSKETELGDISELKFEPKHMLPMFTTTSDDCTGKKCPHYEGCFAQKARARVKSADIAVTNYHLFFADLRIKGADGEGILPKYKHLVLDEAHKAADIAKDFYGFRVTRNGLSYTIRMLDSKQSEKSKKGYLPVIDAKLHKRCIREIDSFFADLTMLYHDKKRYEIRLLKPDAIDAKPLAVAMETAAKALLGASSDHQIPEVRRQELSKRAIKCAQFANHLRAAEMLHLDGDWVYFMEENRNRISLIGKPVDVAEHLQSDLWENHKSVVMTSATMTVSGKFDYIQRELGLGPDLSGTEEGLKTSVVPTPFDFKANAILVVPPMPEPNSKGFAMAVGETLIEIVTEAKGRTLALFTSYRVLKVAYHKLKFANLTFDVLCQGEAPRMQLIERFKSDATSVLLGTESFWAGVDVPGEALSCVVIDRLPFPSPADPMEHMLAEKYGRDYFKRRSIPRALLGFRQGTGRLIRTATDRGVMVVLDRRIVEKNYGSSFIRALPKGVQKRRSIEAVGDFLG